MKTSIHTFITTMTITTKTRLDSDKMLQCLQPGFLGLLGVRTKNMFQHCGNLILQRYSICIRFGECEGTIWFENIKLRLLLIVQKYYFWSALV